MLVQASRLNLSFLFQNTFCNTAYIRNIKFIAEIETKGSIRMIEPTPRFADTDNLKFDFRYSLLPFFDFKKFTFAYAQHAGHDTVRENLDLGVEVADVAVVKSA